MSLRHLAVVLVPLLLVGAGCSQEDDAKASDRASQSPAEQAGLVITDAWVRATAGTKDPSMTAAFMSLENEGPQKTLTGASTEVAGKTEIHEMVMGDSGAMVMRVKEGGLELPTGAHEHLEPGGNHLMLMGVKDELKAGDEVTLTLEFADGSEQELTVPVKEFTEEEGSYEHSHAPSDSASK